MLTPVKLKMTEDPHGPRKRVLEKVFSALTLITPAITKSENISNIANYGPFN